MTAAPRQAETMGTVGAPLPRTMTRTRLMDSALKLVDHYFLLPQRRDCSNVAMSYKTLERLYDKPHETATSIYNMYNIWLEPCFDL